MSVLLIIINIIIFILLAPLFEGVVRKITAKVQSRQGPPVIQPYYDLIKLLGKQNFNSGSPLFGIAPVIALASILSAIAITPVGSSISILSGYADIITIIYILTLGGVSVLLGALSGKNTYGLIGSSREMITMIMVEPVLAMTFIMGAVKMKSLNISSALFSTSSSGYGWSVVIMLIVYLMALQAFVGRQPFDTAEAEVELLEGPFIEYSGPNYALFKFYLMLKQMFYASLFVTVFIPFLKTGYYIADLIIQLFEILVVFLFIALIGSTNPRLRIDQTIKYYAVLIFVSLVAVGLSVYGI
jgi:formate hydrogenlyase subunit 4